MSPADSHPSIRFSRRAAAAIAALVLVACSTPTPTAAPTDSGALRARVAHVVVVWLKDPSDEATRDALVRASLGFEEIDGVVDVKVASAIASDRPVVEDGFDLGILVLLRDYDALDAYLAHPDHVRAGRELLTPAAARVLVYDMDVGSRDSIRIADPPEAP